MSEREKTERISEGSARERATGEQRDLARDMCVAACAVCFILLQFVTVSDG